MMSGAAAGANARVAVVLVTAPSPDVAAALVRTLVEERLAACGNIVTGLTSIYRWEGAVHTDSEALIILKATAESLPRLIERVPEIHPYSVPEVLALPVLQGHEPYLAWVRENTRIVTE